MSDVIVWICNVFLAKLVRMSLGFRCILSIDLVSFKLLDCLKGVKGVLLDVIAERYLNT